MNINDWKTIQTRHDVKYIKRKLAHTSIANWSLVVDVLLVLLGFACDQIFAGSEIVNVGWIWVVITVVAVLVPVTMGFVQMTRNKRREENARKVLNPQDIVALFDDEVCYTIMSAETFVTNLKNNEAQCDTKQKALMQEFLFIEASYYLNKSVRLLKRMENNLSSVISEKSGKNRLARKRVNNAINLILSLYVQLCGSAADQKATLQKFDIVLDLTEVEDRNGQLQKFVKANKQILQGPDRNNEAS